MRDRLNLEKTQKNIGFYAFYVFLGVVKGVVKGYVLRNY